MTMEPMRSTAVMMGEQADVLLYSCDKGRFPTDWTQRPKKVWGQTSFCRDGGTASGDKSGKRDGSVGSGAEASPRA